MSEELAPETPEAAEAEPVKQRKNGLHPGISDELAENMKSGWADTELHGLEPIAQASHTAARRAALSARFPGERLVIPRAISRPAPMTPSTPSARPPSTPTSPAT